MEEILAEFSERQYQGGNTGYDGQKNQWKTGFFGFPKWMARADNKNQQKLGKDRHDKP